MGDRPESRVPRLSGALDPARTRTLPLDPSDGYLLSRIDGTSSIEELAEATGIPLDDVIVSIIKLESLGIVSTPRSDAKALPPNEPRAKAPLPKERISRDEPDSERQPSATMAAAKPSSEKRIPASASSRKMVAAKPALEKRSRSSSQKLSAAKPASGSGAAAKPIPERPPEPKPISEKPAPVKLASEKPPAAAGQVEDVEIDPDHQKQIDTLYAQLGELDHYGILGLDGSADKKAVKRAYFELTGRFHPDRFFRKKLGSFKTKMEVIFVRMTEAHDTLTRDQKRTEYDAYLASIDKSRLIEQMVEAAMGEVRKAEDAARPVVPTPPPSAPLPPPSQPRIGFHDETPPTGTRRSPSDPTTAPTTGAFGREPTTSTRPFQAESPTARSLRARISVTEIVDESPEGRKDQLARRLTGRPSRPSVPPPSDPAPKPADAMEALKRRYEEKVVAAKASQLRKYTEAGMAARERGDMVEAANSLRVALSFDPENPELKASYEEAQRGSDKLLADQYAKQADYEEKAEKWAEAARSWQRVARAREKDAKAHERAAYCLLKSDGDLHEASTLAQKALLLAPKELQIRITLANVYLAAGLAKNAKRELEAAAAIAPDDPHVAGLLKRLSKAG